MDTPTLLNYITLPTKVRIFNDLRAEIGGEAEEGIFDLQEMADYMDFESLYGKDTAKACFDRGRYWLAGNAFYAHVLDITMTRNNPIAMVTNENINKMILNAYSMVE